MQYLSALQPFGLQTKAEAWTPVASKWKSTPVSFKVETQKMH